MTDLSISLPLGSSTSTPTITPGVSDLTLTFPVHCDSQRTYHFKLNALDGNTVKATTAEVVLDTYGKQMEAPSY